MATPGNLVVPISTIVEQLAGKLTQAEIDALLLGVLAKRKTEVQPGDLITAELMNQVLAEIADLQIRVATLENTTGPAGPLNISKVLPPVLRMGEELKVFGSGLLPSKLKRISIEGTDVQLAQLKSGANDSLIAFDVPPILGIPDAGKTVVLTVESLAGSSDFESFYLLPGVATNLEATFTITRTTVSPTGALLAPPPTRTYDFTYSIQAYTSRDETYVLEPKLIGAPAGWSAAMKDGATEILIPKSQPTPSTRPVVVTVTTGASGGGTLSLGLRAKNFSSVTGSSQPESIAIGSEPGAPNVDVVFMSPTVAGSVQKYSNGSLYIRTDSNVANQMAVINPLNVQLAQPGIYTIGTPIVSSTAWTITINNSPTYFDTTGTPNAIRGILFTVKAIQAGAPDATAEIPLTGSGSLPDGSFKFNLKLRADPSNPSPA